ncbi:MAG: MarC family protein, partial [Puniceicoccales bacterium]|nr:MarC family protein [Puniceicoccales bacterium]
LTKHNTVEERLQISRKICCIAGALLCVFAFLGKIILQDIFHISTEAFQIGGGLYLLTVGLGMAFSAKESGSGKNQGNSAAEEMNISSLIVTPLATPLFIGPATITKTIEKLMGLPPSLAYNLTFYAALVVTFLLAYFTFILGCKFSSYLTPSLLKIVEKLVGVFLICIALSSILSGITKFLCHS